MKKKIVFFIWPPLLLLALAIDIFTPLGFADYFFYSAILFLFVYSNKKLIVLAGITNVVFILIGYYFSPNEFSIPLYIAITNRFLGCLLVVFVVYVLLKIAKGQGELRKKVNELDAANKELESFNFISSHDLQEPLRKIQNFVSVLHKEKNISDDGKYYLQELSETSKQMRLLIEDLLKYSRIKKTNLNFERVKLNNVFDEVIANFKEAITEKKAIIQIEGHCEANIVRFLFRQVISNLIENSLKYTYPDRQPQIIIKSDIVYGNSLKPKTPSDLHYSHISVIDNGIGFDPQYNDRVFDFFERLHGQKYPGTGLGLAICRKIVEIHSGIITANGELNKGVQFDIYIPAKRQ